jgi:hypothetical protein
MSLPHGLALSHQRETLDEPPLVMLQAGSIVFRMTNQETRALWYALEGRPRFYGPLPAFFVVEPGDPLVLRIGRAIALRLERQQAHDLAQGLRDENERSRGFDPKTGRRATR